MFDWIGSLISGGASLLGGSMQNSNSRENANQAFYNNAILQGMSQQYNSAEAEFARQFNAKEALKQRDWAAELSGTAFQRASADMRAAGLNPILMAGGPGASTPSSGAAHGPAGSASSNSAPMAQATDWITPAVSTALQAMNLSGTLQQLEAQTAKTTADIDLSKAGVREADARTAETLSRIPGNRAAPALAKAQTEYNIQSAKEKAVSASRGSQEYRQIEKFGPDQRSRSLGTMGEHVVDAVKPTVKRIIDVAADSLSKNASPSAKPPVPPSSAKDVSQNELLRNNRIGRFIPQTEW